MKLALIVGNRGAFPSSVLIAAREDMRKAAARAGVELLESDMSMTRNGAVETTKEGLLYSQFLKDHHGEFDGVVICLPNFGDENGIKAAISDVTVPVLLQAYPDEIGKMGIATRRDAFCGKFGLSSVLKQMNFKYTSGTPFVMHPLSDDFNKELKEFAAICRVVRKMRRMRIGVYGARTTPFKSVRYDEIALEKHGIDVETFDLTNVFSVYESMKDSDVLVKSWVDRLHDAAAFNGVPAGVDTNLARMGAAFETIQKDNMLDAVCIRCWNEMPQMATMSPCAAMGVLTTMGVPAICETDVTNAIIMIGLSAASEKVSGCLDINNNYGDDPDKCILFHCGPIPADLMQGKGQLKKNNLLGPSLGVECWGLNVGRMKPGEMTISGGRTEDGQFQFYLDKGEFTDDPIVEEDFFGTGGVFRLEGMQPKLMHIAEAGFRHHSVVTPGDQVRAVNEAFTKYLGYKRIDI